MPDNDQITNGLMTAVPAPLRRQVMAGMRWTFWLSVLAVPFSYGTSILLARAGPEVIGTYGLLMVYIGAVANLLYFGGDPVVIKFVPELPRDKRASFLASYLVILTVLVVPWLVLASVWPRGLHYLFGDQSGRAFQVLILYLSPLYIFYSLVIAAHKAVLDMRAAQLMTRVVTFGSFAAYAGLFFAARQVLSAYYAEWIWGIYLGIILLATMTGAWHLGNFRNGGAVGDHSASFSRKASGATHLRRSR